MEKIEKIEGETLPSDVLSEFKNFATLMSELKTACDFFEHDSFLRQEYEISEQELREHVRKARE